MPKARIQQVFNDTYAQMIPVKKLNMQHLYKESTGQAILSENKDNQINNLAVCPQAARVAVSKN